MKILIVCGNAFFVVCLMLITGLAYSQPPMDIGNAVPKEEQQYSKLEFWEDSIATYTHDLQNKVVDEDRLLTNKKIIPLLVKALREPGSFNYPFDNLEYLAKAYAPDSTFRLLTWFVKLDNGENRYFGAIQQNNENNKIVPFFQNKNDIVDIRNAKLNPEKWYGAIYYNITKVSDKKRDYYMLYGWDGGSFLSTKKILDVLYFEGDSIKLGAPIIQTKNDEAPIHRLILEYKKEAAVTINYDDTLGMIVYDHIIPEDGKSFGMYPTYVPDGSYEALKFKKGTWQYVEKVFHQTQDEAPITVPLFEDKGPLPVSFPKN